MRFVANSLGFQIGAFYVCSKRVLCLPFAHLAFFCVVDFTFANLSSFVCRECFKNGRQASFFRTHNSSGNISKV